VGENYQGSIENCYSTGEVRGDSRGIGGLVGKNNEGSITNCYSIDSVTGHGDMSTGGGTGGLVGTNFKGSIANCYGDGVVSGELFVGGLVGWNRGGTITDCHGTGVVNGSHGIGGLVGSNSRYYNYNDDYSPAIIVNCYATGVVTKGENSSPPGICVGGLVGTNYLSNIINCYATGPVSGEYSVGGLAGENIGGDMGQEDNYYGIIANCYATGAVTGSGEGYVQYTGGLVGQNDEGTITACYAVGSVNGNDYVGGLVGLNYSYRSSHRYPSVVANCYATGAVSGNSNVGGLAGFNGNTDLQEAPGVAEVINCYAVGSVTGNSSIGGLAGYNRDPNYITASSWDIETSSWTTSDGGQGLTTAEMQDMDTFTSAGWDFDYDDGDDADWFIQIEEYPILVWQISPADIYTDGRNDFRDFAVFAQFWMRDDCAIYNYYCDWADMDFNGYVDIDDLMILIDYWLEKGIYN